MDNIMTSLFLCGAGFAVVLLVAFVGFVIVEGFSGMTPEMLSFTGSGMGNMFFNTLCLGIPGADCQYHYGHSRRHLSG